MPIQPRDEYFNYGRKKANKELLEKISKCLERNPDLRFFQALLNLGIARDGIDGQVLWAEESTETLERMKMRFQ